MHRDQVRARNAFRFVQGPLQDAGAFLTMARKLPVMLQTNGLLATWAHLLAKNNSEHQEALAALTSHLQSLGLAGQLTPSGLFDDWIDADRGLSSAELRRRTAEAMEFSVWVKRAAEALCDMGTAAPASPAQDLPSASEEEVES
jgi:CRISPR/Cas system CMR-associated protein Cmr5 small subunit